MLITQSVSCFLVSGFLLPSADVFYRVCVFVFLLGIYSVIKYIWIQYSLDILLISVLLIDIMFLT